MTITSSSLRGQYYRDVSPIAGVFVGSGLQETSRSVDRVPAGAGAA
ncbi:hypothetical protein [Jiella marina]|nr:hypothetical protein [Jiella sp. LLJ827]MCQ0989253.1 hypothetical protein [Jiella sp. LLJ827]